MKIKLNKKILFSMPIISSLLVTVPVLASGYDYTYSNAADAAAATTFLGGTFLLACCPLIIYVVFDLVIAYIVYSDAKKNKVENGVLWAVITFFFSLIGLLVYFLAIRPEAMKKHSGMATPMPETKKEENMEEPKKE